MKGRTGTARYDHIEMGAHYYAWLGIRRVVSSATRTIVPRELIMATVSDSVLYCNVSCRIRITGVEATVIYRFLKT